MKKILWGLVLGMTLLAACSDDGPMIPSTEEVEIPETGTAIYVKLDPLVSRAHLDGPTSFVWNKNDSIIVQGNENSTFKLVSGEGTSLGKFRGELPETSFDSYVVFYDKSSRDTGIQTEHAGTDHLHLNMISDFYTPEQILSDTIVLASHNSLIQLDIASLPQGLGDVHHIQVAFEKQKGSHSPSYSIETATSIELNPVLSGTPFTANFSLINNYLFQVDRVTILFYGSKKTFEYTTSFEAGELKSGSLYKMSVSADSQNGWKEMEEPFLQVLMHGTETAPGIDTDIVPKQSPVTGYWEYRGVAGQKNAVIPIASFMDNEEVDGVTISEGVEMIDDYAFMGCLNLSQVELPQTLTKINAGAFYHCASLSEIRLPESVEFMGDGAFAEATELKVINLPKKLTCLSEELFSGCIQLTSITLPASLEEIGEDTFKKSGLTSIVLPEKTVKVDGKAFANCDQLESLTIQGVLDASFAGFKKLDTQKIHLKLNRRWLNETGRRKPIIETKSWMDASWASIECID